MLLLSEGRTGHPHHPHAPPSKPSPPDVRKAAHPADPGREAAEEERCSRVRLLRDHIADGEGGLAGHLQLVKDATVADLERRLLAPEIELELKAKHLESTLQEQREALAGQRAANRQLKDDLAAAVESAAAYRDALRELLAAGSDSVETMRTAVSAAATSAASAAEARARGVSVRLAGLLHWSCT